MRLQTLLFFALLICFRPTAIAAPVTYFVSVDTSSIQGKTGSLDFQFNPGPFGTQAASAQVLNFGSNGSPLGSPFTAGDAGGALAGVLSFDNGTGYNDYFQEFTYGSMLSLDISLFGSALSTPDGVSTSGSAFAFSMFSDPTGTLPVFTSDMVNGFAYIVNVNLDGSTTVTDNITSPGPVQVQSSPVPEPTSIALLATGSSLIILALRRKHTTV